MIRISAVLMLAVLQSPPAVPPDVAKHALELARACVEKSPEKYRSVWGSALDYDKMNVSQTSIADNVNVTISETAPKGKPQGVAVRIDLKTGECTNFTDRLE